MNIPPIFVSNTMVDLIKRVQQVIEELNTNVLKVGDVSDSANAAFALEANNAAFLGGHPPEYYLVGTAENANNATYLNGKSEGELNVNSAVTAGTANNAIYAFGKSEAGLNVNSAITANSATYLGSKQEAGLNVNSALTANSSTYLGAKQEAGLNVNSAVTANSANSASYLGTKQEAGLNVNSALTANSSTYLGSKQEAGLNVNSAVNANTANNATYAYGKQESALNVNSALTSNTANSTTYLGAKQEAGLNVNSAVNANTANNSTYAFGKTEVNLNVNSALTTNNAINFGGQPASYYTNASHLSTGTVAPQRLGSGTPDGTVFLAGDGTWKAPNTVPGTVENANNATYLGGKAEADLNVNSAVWLTGNAVTTNSSALRVGNSTVFTTVNATAFSGAANSATYLGSKQEAALNVNSALTANSSAYLGSKQEAGLNVNNASTANTANNATYAYGKQEVSLNVNSALNANSATYLGAKQEAGLNVNSALTANSSAYLGSKQEAGLNVNNASTANTANNATYVFGKTEGALNVNSASSALSANNADYLDGQHAAYYQNASNLSTGTVPVARLSGTATALTANNATYAYGKSEAGLNVNTALIANSATYLGSKQEAGLNVNSALTANSSTYLGAKQEAGLNANSALSANNADYLDGQHGAYYTNASNLGTGTVPVARLSGTATNLTANNATNAFGKAENQLNVNSALTANSSTYLGTKQEAGLNVNSALTANSSTYLGAKQESALNANSALSANNADYLDGQHGAYYTNASNLGTGTVPTARLTEANTTVNGIVTTAAQSFAGPKTFTGNVVVGSNTLFVSTSNNVSVNASPNTSYAMHIAGDVNFTGTLYQNGTVAQFGGGNTAASFKKLDSIAAQFNGAQTVFSLLSGGVSCAVTVENQLLISLDGYVQEPGVAFTASGSTITFTTAPNAGMTFFGLRFGQPIDVGDATSLNGKAEGALNVNSASTALTANNSTYAFGKSEAGLNVNSALTSNNSTNFAGQGQSYYTNASNLGSGTIPVARLSGTATNLTANNATYAYGKNENALNVNSALTSNNTTYAFGKSEGGLNVNSASNSDYLDGQHGSYYTNASNLGTGTLPDARLSSNVALRNANNAFTGLLAANTTVNGSYVLNITGDINYVGNLYQNGVLAQFGGAGGAVTSDTPPADPANGALWWDSTVGMLRIYYNDGSSSQWVDAFSGGQSILNIGADAQLRNVTANSVVGTGFGDFSGATGFCIGPQSNRTRIATDGAGQFNFVAANNDWANISVGTIKERNRSVPMGEWIAPGWNNAYLTTGAGSLSSISCSTYTYTLIGKTLILSYDITATVTSGTYLLSLAIPGSFVAARRNMTSGMANMAGGNFFAYIIYTSAAGVTVVSLQTPNAGTGQNWNGVCNLTGTIALEIQ